MLSTFLIDIFRDITCFLSMFIYWDTLWPQNPIWPPSAILDRGIRRFLFQILKLWDLIYTHAKKKKIVIEENNLWTVLISYNLLQVVNLSGRRHLGFLVSTKNIARNGFYVSLRYFRGIIRSPAMFRYRDMLWPQNPIWPPSAILDWGSGEFYFRFQNLGSWSIFMHKMVTLVSKWTILCFIGLRNSTIKSLQGLAIIL